MLMVISPAKTLDFETPPTTQRHSQPDFLDAAASLVELLRLRPPQEISELMGISDKLGELNSRRFLDWAPPFTPDNAKAAVLAFRGDVYTGLEAERFDEDDFAFAQDHLRILSGLYGLLRPLDLIQPYRLEMGTRLANPAGRNLYAWWGGRLTAALNRQLGELGSHELVNLASNEYFSAVQPGELAAEVIQPVFQDLKGDRYKVISFYAKKARGLMSAWAIRQRITRAEDLKAFDVAGYRYAPERSSAREWVFTRDTAA